MQIYPVVPHTEIEGKSKNWVSVKLVNNWVANHELRNVTPIGAPRTLDQESQGNTRQEGTISSKSDFKRQALFRFLSENRTLQDILPYSEAPTKRMNKKGASNVYLCYLWKAMHWISIFVGKLLLV